MFQQSGTSLLRSHGMRSARFALFSSHGLRSAWFALSSVVTKWKYLVPCAQTALSAVHIVLSPNKVELACYVCTGCVQCARIEFSAVRIIQCCNEVEVSCSLRMDCAERGSHCSKSDQSGTRLLRSHGLRSARFALFSSHGLR